MVGTQRRDSRRYVSFSFIWCGALFTLATLPYVIAIFFPPPGRDGLGAITFVPDFAQYEAAMAEGIRSPSWLIHDHFTPEPHRPAFMFPLYVGIGKLAAALELPPMGLYRAAEFVGRLTVLASIAWVTPRLVPGAGALALVLATAGAGPGIWTALIQVAVGVRDPYVGNFSHEMNNYLLLFAPPHVAFGMALALAIVAILVEAEAAWSPLRAGALMAASVALSLLHSFNVPTLLVIAGALVGLTLGGRNDSAPRVFGVGTRSLAALVVLGVSAGPFLLYNAATFGADPFWSQTYWAQNLLPSPAPHKLIVDLGVLLIAGAPGLVVLWRAGGPHRRIAVPVAIMLVSMYAPVPFQRRLAFGVAPLLGIIAGFALALWLPQSGPHARRNRWGLVAILVAALGSPLTFYGLLINSVLLNAPIAVYRATPDLRAARDWLVEHTMPDDVILASWDVANYLAGAIPGRTPGGGGVPTVDATKRRAMAAAAFASQAGQEAMARQERPGYIVSAGPAEPIFLERATPVFQRGTVAVARLPRARPP